MASARVEELEQVISQQSSAYANLQKVDPVQAWTPSIMLTVAMATLVFGLIVMGLMAYLIRSGRRAESVLRAFGTMLVIIAAVFLVVTGYTEKQIAPVMGLLGTVAGYLLGRGADNNGHVEDRGEMRVTNVPMVEGSLGGQLPQLPPR